MSWLTPAVWPGRSDPVDAGQLAQPQRQPLNWLDRRIRRLVLSRLASLRGGRLQVADELGTVTCGGVETGDLRVALRVHHRRFYRRVLFGGALGAAQAYIDGDWSCDNLVGIVQLLARNRASLEQLARGPARGLQWIRDAWRIGRGNTRVASRRRIAAHYDLSNEFFALFLDDTLTYSSGIFASAETSLRDASLAKYERIGRKLRLGPQDHVLEIGSGWGGFAMYAAQHYGCRVTTTTISRQQYELAQQRIQAAGLQDRVTIVMQDYRDLRGQYDKLVSIEMIEAVGHEYLGTYFRQCARLLKPEGMMLLQAITIPDARYARYRRSQDFIQRYIFPGGCLPSISAIGQALRQTDFRLSHLEDFGSHYARTLLHWRAKFWANIEAIRALGYPPEFVRTWDFYFCYCAGGFLEQQIGVAQLLLARSACRHEPILTPLV